MLEWKFNWDRIVISSRLYLAAVINYLQILVRVAAWHSRHFGFGAPFETKETQRGYLQVFALLHKRGTIVTVSYMV